MGVKKSATIHVGMSEPSDGGSMHYETEPFRNFLTCDVCVLCFAAMPFVT